MRTYEEAKTLCMDCEMPATHSITYGSFISTPDLYCGEHIVRATPEPFEDVEFTITKLSE